MTTDQLRLRPELAWPVQFSAEEARRLVSRRLKNQIELTTTLYHHPFLGLVFQGPTRPTSFFPRPSRMREAELIRAHVLVDLVGGKAYLSDAWDLRDFVSIRRGDGADTITDPEPKVHQAAAVSAARAVLAGVVLRRRKMTPIHRLELVEPPIRLGKPNWWVTNQGPGRSTEVIVDGITGRHYAFSA